MKMKEMLSTHLYEMEMFKYKIHLWCFKIHASFCLNFMVQVNYMQTAYGNGLNYQTSSESDSSSLSISSKSESMSESFS